MALVFVYRDRPTLTVTVGDLMRMYFERNPNQPTINIAGLVNGDTFDYATDGTTFATDTTPIYAPPGTYAGALQLLSLAASDVGYNLVVDPGDITVTPSPNTPAPFVFNNNGATGPTPGQPRRNADDRGYRDRACDGARRSSWLPSESK